MHVALRDTRAAPGPAADGLVIQSGGPLAAGAAHREAAGILVKARECVTAQSSEAEDRGGMRQAELAARLARLPEPSLASCPLPNDLARPDALSWSWAIFNGRCARVGLACSLRGARGGGVCH